MRQIGFIFILSALTKLWASVYLTEFYLLKTLEVTQQYEGDALTNIPTIVWFVIFSEILIGLLLIFFKSKKSV